MNMTNGHKPEVKTMRRLTPEERRESLRELVLLLGASMFILAVGWCADGLAHSIVHLIK